MARISGPVVARDVAVKYLGLAGALLVSLGWLAGLGFWIPVYAAVWLTIVTYLLGDLLLYRWVGGVWAAIVEFVLAALTVWLFLLANRHPQPAWVIWDSALLTAIVDYFYHRLLRREGYRARV
ncbi:conserved membrane protein of unknown function [Candidatus Hydrogenisulfobacillus filiaventi]|uniref:DUF2512 domain-containing protein n=1 Tax=Candidatus Hydrogenisulfobacillus filiaventi TaxID=2707344 RepID=A0A6F8ZJN1_9FIRM|nr:DUF2512 family protein [Bacillota bacterium]CAB1129881.1 conserved membrane protein of unknown function [Candidatus Hydrogenisulfobacillus filiaventi]